VVFEELKDLVAELGGDEEGDENQPPKKKILLVDDDADVRRSLALVLSRTYDVVLAGDAKAAVEALQDDLRVVILDVKMPGDDGFWVCERIQERHPYMPIIFHSAYQDVKDPYEIMNKHRPYAYITKGENPARLLEAVANAAKMHERLIQNRTLVQSLEHAKEARRKR
jgi:DNA-binding NtrC family response regulator